MRGLTAPSGLWSTHRSPSDSTVSHSTLSGPAASTVSCTGAPTDVAGEMRTRDSGSFLFCGSGHGVRVIIRLRRGRSVTVTRYGRAVAGRSARSHDLGRGAFHRRRLRARVLLIP